VALGADIVEIVQDLDFGGDDAIGLLVSTFCIVELPRCAAVQQFKMSILLGNAGSENEGL